MSELNETVIATAAEWVVLLDDPSASEQMHKDFASWMQADPVHPKAFHLAQQTWGEFDEVLPMADIDYDDEPSIYVEEKNGDTSHQFESHWAIAKLRSVPVWTKTIAGLGLAASFAFMVFSSPNLVNTPPPMVSYATEIGEVDSIVLSDDTTMFMNSGTQLNVKFSKQARIVTLVKGEAHFDVATDADRPFSVIAGDRIVQAIGTAFSVRHGDLNDVVVTVSEGRVLMREHVDAASIEDIVQTPPKLAIDSNKAAPKKGATIKEAALTTDIPRDAVSKETILRAGDRLDVSNDALSLISDIPVDKLERDLAWRHGGLIFDRDQLKDVINVMSLYTDAQIVIKDPALQAMEVGGYFKIDDIDSMLNLLEVGLAVDVERVNNNLIEIRSR